MQLLKVPPEPLVREAVIRVQRILCAIEDRALKDFKEGWTAEALATHERGMLAAITHARQTLPADRNATLDAQMEAAGVVSDYEAVRALASPYDAPLALLEFHDTWRDLARSFHLMEGYAYPEKQVVIATAQHAAHNARAFAVRGSDVQVIVFNHRMFEFLQGVALILAALLQPEGFPEDGLEDGRLLDPRGFTPQWENNPRLDAAIAFFLGQHEDASIRSGSIGPNGLPFDLFAFDIYQALKYFVLGHELGHLYLGHTDNHALWPALNENGAPPLLEYLPRHTEEYEADLAGFEVAMGAAAINKVHMQTFMWAVPLFFHANAWLEAQWRTDDAAELDACAMSNTHPPLAARASALTSVISTLGDGYRLDLLTDLNRAMLERIQRGRAQSDSPTDMG